MRLESASSVDALPWKTPASWDLGLAGTSWTHTWWHSRQGEAAPQKWPPTWEQGCGSLGAGPRASAPLQQPPPSPASRLCAAPRGLPCLKLRLVLIALVLSAPDAAPVAWARAGSNLISGALTRPCRTPSILNSSLPQGLRTGGSLPRMLLPPFYFENSMGFGTQITYVHEVQTR